MHVADSVHDPPTKIGFRAHVLVKCSSGVAHTVSNDVNSTANPQGRVLSGLFSLASLSIIIVNCHHASLLGGDCTLWGHQPSSQPTSLRFVVARHSELLSAVASFVYDICLSMAKIVVETLTLVQELYESGLMCVKIEIVYGEFGCLKYCIKNLRLRGNWIILIHELCSTRLLNYRLFLSRFMKHHRRILVGYFFHI